MAQTRPFDDPKAGAAFAKSELFKAIHANPVYDGLRLIDTLVHYWLITSWGSNTLTLTGAGGDNVRIGWLLNKGIWCVGYKSTNTLVRCTTPDLLRLETPTTVPSLTHGVNSVGQSADRVVFGLAPTGAATTKIMHSSDGQTWTSANLGSSDTKSVDAIIWDQQNSLFIALETTGGAYTSDSTAATWTSRTVPAGLSAATWGGLAVNDNSDSSLYGRSVAVAQSTTAYMTSDDGGVTWTERTGPVSSANSSVTFNTALETWLWYTDSAAWYSTDGITWTSVTLFPSAWSDGTATLSKIVSVSAAYVVMFHSLGGAGNHAELQFALGLSNPAGWVPAAMMPVDDIALDIAHGSAHMMAAFESNAGADAVLYATK